jgi:D-glycero-beta-D-manno-heptose 1-phosphate adenylyltransferase
MPQNKIYELDSVGNVCRDLKSRGEKIVLTSGCFDLLHPGHLEHLVEVGAFGCLVVGINSDQFVKKMKGPYRPLHNERNRAFLMAGFSPVRLVTIFDDDYRLIEAVQPDIYVLHVMSHVRTGDDPDRVALLKRLGAEIREVGGVKVDSTTNIIKRAAVAAANSRYPI